MWTHSSSWIRGMASGFVTRRRMSRLTARIMAIMLFPLAIFLVGLLSLDQYRTTLIQSEFVALERQGFTLARSLALAEAARDRRAARRRGVPARGRGRRAPHAGCRGVGGVLASRGRATCWDLEDGARGVVG